jgi:hypothetical protein
MQEITIDDGILLERRPGDGGNFAIFAHAALTV